MAESAPVLTDRIALRFAWAFVCACWAAGSALAAEKAPASLDLSKLPAATAGVVDYAKDIQPLLAKHCYSCHGAEKQKSGLRLDRKADALAGGDTGKVILPGKSAESILIHNVAGLDPEMIMPPEDERLSAAEIATLRAWIDGGAIWPDDDAVAANRVTNHWAFKAPKLPAIPPLRNAKGVRNPIDAFVRARLEKENVTPAPEADRVTLIRRLSLDLLGLPPTAQDVASFLDDVRPDAYEKLVDRLLALPHFGERWGRRWLDLARYADSDGYEKDSPRPYAYLFRDWVIDAINRDLPFDQFTIEQLAGDLLPDATDQQKIATGFHRQTLTNREGGVDKEEFRSKATVDRVSTTGSAWMGLTVGCAECHTHKFDPITQREFYQLYAFFNNASEKDIPAPRPSELADYAAAMKTWEAKQAELEPAMQARIASLDREKLQDWTHTLTVPASRWTVLKPARVVIAVGDGETVLTPARDNTISPRLRDTTKGRFVVETTPKAKRITGFRVDALEELGKPIGRGEDGNFALSEFSVTVQTGMGESRKLEIAAARADFEATDGAAALAIDGRSETGWSVASRTGVPHVIVFELKEPIDCADDTKVIFELDQSAVGVMNKFRIGFSTSDLPLQASTLPDALIAILRAPREKRTAKQEGELERYFIEQFDEEGRKLRVALAAHAAAKPKYPETTAAILTAEERKTNVHIRGDFLRKGDEVHPGTLSVLHAFRPRGEKPDRLDLARWILDPANPLTARVAVNHVWKDLFGRALVTSVDDFGTRGDTPSHPELLDWMAITFSAQRSAAGDQLGLGWSRKALIKLIVTSATYRQASMVRPELAERDPNNVLLARQNRFRLEAETVRDLYLATSGLLNPAIGGPSIRPQLPADIAALGYANSVKWQESKGGEQYRRGLYIFFQRTVPYPMLMTFDAPDSNTSCARRERSNTPLQALTLLNDPVFFECAQALGKRVAQTPETTNARIRNVFVTCLARQPNDEELSRLRAFQARQLELMRQSAGSAARIAGESDAANVDEKAAFAALARVIMNLDEFVTRD
jgi:mono/diheme cytochrome c family protein